MVRHGFCQTLISFDVGRCLGRKRTPRRQGRYRLVDYSVPYAAVPYAAVGFRDTVPITVLPLGLRGWKTTRPLSPRPLVSDAAT